MVSIIGTLDNSCFHFDLLLRILMELMSDYQKGSNAPFMEPIDMESDKSQDYLEVVKKPLWLKKSELSAFMFLKCLYYILDPTKYSLEGVALAVSTDINLL